MAQAPSTSSAGAMLVGSRIQSPVKGTGEPMLSMSYVAAEDSVNAGEKIVTSGTLFIDRAAKSD